MNPASIIILSIVALLFSADVIYLIISKYKGKCVGCAISVVNNPQGKQITACRTCPVISKCGQQNSCH